VYLQEVRVVGVYKVNVSLPEDLVGEIDKVAQELGMSRSGFIAEASSRYVSDIKNLSAEERRRKDIQRARTTWQRIGAKLPSEAVQEMIDFTRRERDREWRGEAKR
jgi:hypothetical protein